MPNPKDPEKCEEYRRKMSVIAKAKGYGKWMQGKKHSPQSIEKMIKTQSEIGNDPEERKRRSERAKALGLGKWMKGRKLDAERVEKVACQKRGKTYEEIYGDRADEEKAKRVDPNKRAKAGMRPLHLIEHGARIARERTGKTYAEIYGDSATDQANRRSETHRKIAASRPKREGVRDKHNGEHRYAEWRKAVFERDNYTCRTCWKRGGNLHAHHIMSWSEYPQYRYLVENGMTLCAEPCHKSKHFSVYKSSQDAS